MSWITARIKTVGQERHARLIHRRAGIAQCAGERGQRAGLFATGFKGTGTGRRGDAQTAGGLARGPVGTLSRRIVRNSRAFSDTGTFLSVPAGELKNIALEGNVLDGAKHPMEEAVLLLNNDTRSQERVIP